MMNEFDIIDHPLVFLWFKSFVKTNPFALSFLFSGDANFFKSLYGNPIGKMQNFDFWKINHLGIVIFIYFDGTNVVYKVQYLGDKNLFIDDQNISKHIIDFLLDLINKFSLN